MVIDLVMVTAPKPPGSRQLISPPAAVLEMAPAKVLHGAVRLHGLASSPRPETQVRIAPTVVPSRPLAGRSQVIAAAQAMTPPGDSPGASRLGGAVDVRPAVA